VEDGLHWEGDRGDLTRNSAQEPASPGSIERRALERHKPKQFRGVWKSRPAKKGGIENLKF
jgi:hypothetical protein